MDTNNSLQSIFQEYLNNSFKGSNGYQSYRLYTNPNSNLYEDTETTDAGYQPLRNKDIYINPNRQHSQLDFLDTMFHEYAHADQPRLSSMFNFINPTYRKLNNIDFAGYYNEKEHPGAEEVLATLRSHEAMQHNKTVHDTTMGRDVIQMLKQKYPNMSEQAIRLMLDKAMFPNQNFMYPSTPQQEPSLLQKLFNLW